MANNDRWKNKGRFAGIPHAVMDNRSYIELSFSARALLVELAKQYNKYNNGKLCAIPAQLKERGFKSATTVYAAVQELLDANLIVYSKLNTKGSRKPHYYALTWLSVDDIPKFKMDIKPTKTPLRKFTLERGANIAA
jgi:hypothetical protein